MSYVLLNCTEIQPYTKLFLEQKQVEHPNLSSIEIDAKLDDEFPRWFALYAQDPANNVRNKYIRDLSKGPLRSVASFNGYYVNGYKFHTMTYGSNKVTMNSGVCVKGSSVGADENDYYGQLVEVLELEYPGLPLKKTVLFKCEWFDTSAQGTSIHSDYKMVSVNHKRKYNKYEPFIFAKQAVQVFYCTFPGSNRSRSDWWAVSKIKARSNIEFPDDQTHTSTIDPPFQEDKLSTFRSSIIDIDPDPVHSTSGEIELVEDDNGDDSGDGVSESEIESDLGDDDKDDDDYYDDV